MSHTEATSSQTMPVRDSLGVVWILWFEWVLATFTISVLTCAVGFDVYYHYIYRRMASGETIFAFSGCIGGLVGLVQWFVMRGRIPRAGWWVLANTLGYAIGLPAGGLLGLTVDTFLHGGLSIDGFLLAITITTGIVLAGTILLLQRFIWCRHSRQVTSYISVSAVWVIASVSAVLLAKLAYQAVFTLKLVTTGAVSGAVFGLTYGVMTGGALVGMWRCATKPGGSKEQRQGVVHIRDSVPNPIVVLGGALVLAGLVYLILTGSVARPPRNGLEVIKLYQAGERDFSDLDLSGFDLVEANLSGTDMSGTNLTGSNLRNADLSRTNLSGACLTSARLDFAELERSNLSRADLSEVSLQYAFLAGARLTGTNLSRADLRSAAVTDEQLAQAESLSGAIMPNGTRHE